MKKLFLGLVFFVSVLSTAQEVNHSPSIVGAVWSYVKYGDCYSTISNPNEHYDHHSFFRYTVLDEPMNMNGQVYYPIVKYTTNEYIPGCHEKIQFIRQEGERIYQFMGLNVTDKVLYDFSLETGDSFSEKLKVRSTSSVTDLDGHDFTFMEITSYNGDTWIKGIGGMRDFFIDYEDLHSISPANHIGTCLNYFRSGDGLITYKNPLQPYDATYFQEDDASIVDHTFTPNTRFVYEGKTWYCKGIEYPTDTNASSIKFETTYLMSGDTAISRIPSFWKRIHVHKKYEDSTEIKKTYFTQEQSYSYSSYRILSVKDDEITKHEWIQMGMKVGEFKLSWENDSTKNGWLVKESSDTILNDGIKRRCLKVEYVTYTTTKSGKKTTTVRSKDIWVEGIGSLYSGPLPYDPTLSKNREMTLDKVVVNGVTIYQKKEPLPLLEDGKEWIIQTKGNYAYAPVNTIYLQIAGDTIVNGRNCKKMHHTFIDEFGNKTHSETYCFQEGDKFYSNEQTVMFDFGLNKGDIFSLSSQNKYIVHQVNDTILNDGVKRKCLTMHRYEDNTFADYWIEGIGSLQMGVYSNDIHKTGAYQKLQSVSENGTNIYQSEANTLNTITEAIVNDGKITPEVINETDVATFVVELGVFPGNTSYIQQLDSIVNNTIYISGIYDGHSREIANFEITHSLPLKTFEKGEYTLIHHINAMNGKALTDVRKTNVYHFTVGEANEIVQKVCEFSIKMSNMALTCTSPHATKLEVYTLDAIKVGEATFANGEASVKVNKTPATYLYIVTYPDGRRESGKVMVK